MTKQKMNINSKLKIHFFLLLAACIIAAFLTRLPIGDIPLSRWLSYTLFSAFIAIFPLLFFIPTILKPTAASISWLGFFLLAYLVWAIIKTLSSNGLIGGLLITTFNLSTFFYVVVWLRPLKKIAKAQQKSNSGE